MSANGSVFHHRAQSQGTGKQKTKAEDLPLLILCLHPAHRKKCFYLFHFPRRFPFWLFSLGRIQCNDDTYKKTCVSGKGRLVNDKCYSNVTVTVILLDRVVFVL